MGSGVGSSVGTPEDGVWVGSRVGGIVETALGEYVGESEGVFVLNDAELLGERVGKAVGVRDGETDGVSVGDRVGFGDGTLVGTRLGTWVGLMVG